MSLATFEWNSSWEYNQRKEQELSEAVNYDIHRLNKVSHMSWDSGPIMCIYFLVPVADVEKICSYHFIKYLIALELIMNDDKQKWVSDITEIESEFSF